MLQKGYLAEYEDIPKNSHFYYCHINFSDGRRELYYRGFF